MLASRRGVHRIPSSLAAEKDNCSSHKAIPQLPLQDRHRLKMSGGAVLCLLGCAPLAGVFLPIGL
jgi:hypothetical protein